MAPPRRPPDSPRPRRPAVPPIDNAMRVARLLLLRTIVITVVLGLSVWLLARSDTPQRLSMWLQSAVIGATYVSTIVFGVLLRRGFSPGLAWRDRCTPTISC